MTEPTRRAWASIDGKAIHNNLARVQSLSPGCRIFPVIKANGYGHGLAEIARALAASPARPDGLAVASLDEALCLKPLDLQLPILVMNGFINADELALCLENELQAVVHAGYQVALLEQALKTPNVGKRQLFWLKLNSGMNRLGMSAEDCKDAWQRLHQYPGVECVLMSHLAWADELDKPASRSLTDLQLQRFEALRSQIQRAGQEDIACSVAASSGVLAVPASHYQIVRPGIMLYGSCPLSTRSAEELGLQPAMTLSSRLIDIKQVGAGESVGYGATYTCAQETPMGIVSIGYGDGYPRAAANGTPVLVRTAGGDSRTSLMGRVSMDMITIDLSAVPDARVGDEVVLWGQGLDIDEIARMSGTIAYELMCKVTTRVPRIYHCD